MLYTIKEYDPAAEQTYEHGVFASFEDAMRFKWDIMDSVVPISDEKARKFILMDIYEQIEIEYSEHNLSECDEYDELKSDMFDDEINDYISRKAPGWELLLNYDRDKDNAYVG